MLKLSVNGAGTKGNSVSDRIEDWARAEGNVRLMLQDALITTEEKELVFDDRTADVTAELVALKGGLGTAYLCSSCTGILEVVKTISVEVIGSGLRRDKNLPRRGHFTGYVLSGAIELKLLNCTARHIVDSGTDRFVGDVLTVEEDACGLRPRSAR